MFLCLYCVVVYVCLFLVVFYLLSLFCGNSLQVYECHFICPLKLQNEQTLL